MFSDQPGNANEAERLGFGLSVPFHLTSVEVLVEALEKVLGDAKYAATARKLGSALVDQKEHPLDRAVWWLEHIMKYPDLYRGRSPAHRLTWYQHLCLDIIAFVIFVTTLVSYVSLKLIMMCCCRRAAAKNKRD